MIIIICYTYVTAWAGPLGRGWCTRMLQDVRDVRDVQDVQDVRDVWDRRSTSSHLQRSPPMTESTPPPSKLRLLVTRIDKGFHLCKMVACCLLDNLSGCWPVWTNTYVVYLHVRNIFRSNIYLRLSACQGMQLSSSIVTVNDKEVELTVGHNERPSLVL